MAAAQHLAMFGKDCVPTAHTNYNRGSDKTTRRREVMLLMIVEDLSLQRSEAIISAEQSIRYTGYRLIHRE